MCIVTLVSCVSSLSIGSMPYVILLWSFFVVVVVVVVLSFQDVDFWGYIYPTFYALPHLKRTHGKIIVNASVTAWQPYPRMSIYNVCKKKGSLSFYLSWWVQMKLWDWDCLKVFFLKFVFVSRSDLGWWMMFLRISCFLSSEFVRSCIAGCPSGHLQLLRHVAYRARVEHRRDHDRDTRMGRERDDNGQVPQQEGGNGGERRATRCKQSYLPFFFRRRTPSVVFPILECIMVHFGNGTC